jgi:hypothetical protein
VSQLLIIAELAARSLPRELLCTPHRVKLRVATSDLGPILEAALLFVPSVSRRSLVVSLDTTAREGYLRPRRAPPVV